MKPLISVIMPTLNEEKNISRALKSIRMQTVNQKLVEILVIDGGSTDRTREIAESFGARVLDNPKVLPEEAKRVGLSGSSGRYIIFMDADEEFTHNEQVKRRLVLFESCERVKAIMYNGCITPTGLPKLTRYANSFGDPFSHFVYRYDGENIISSLRKRNIKIEKYCEFGRVFTVEGGNALVIGDACTVMYDYEYIKEHFSDRYYHPSFVSTIFDHVVGKTSCFGVIEGDNVNHYTSVTFRTYLRKLKFRVIMNLSSEESDFGYSARANMNKRLFDRKYLFVLYCLLPPVVLIDSVFMVVRKKSIIFILHFLFVYYVIFTIAYCKVLRLLGVKVRSGTYGR